MFIYSERLHVSIVIGALAQLVRASDSNALLESSGGRPFKSGRLQIVFVQVSIAFVYWTRDATVLEYGTHKS